MKHNDEHEILTDLYKMIEDIRAGVVDSFVVCYASRDEDDGENIVQSCGGSFPGQIGCVSVLNEDLTTRIRNRNNN